MSPMYWDTDAAAMSDRDHLVWRRWTMPENVQCIPRRQIDKDVEMYWLLSLLNYSSYTDELNSMIPDKDFQLKGYRCWAEIVGTLELRANP